MRKGLELRMLASWLDVKRAYFIMYMGFGNSTNIPEY